MKLKNAEFATRKKRATKYALIVQHAAALGHKRCWPLPGTATESRRLCIRQALNRYLPDAVKAKKRYEVRRGATAIIIVCYHLSREK